MSANHSADFLVEIGTEELPPKALPSLIAAFAENLAGLLHDNRLAHGAITQFATPRRLALVVAALACAQDDRSVVAKGPPVRIAFDEKGKPTAAAEAFAKKCGTSVDLLQRSMTDKGEWLFFESTETGQAAHVLLPALVEQALQALPIPRRMRWGDSEIEFVRPVHWSLMLHGPEIVAGKVMGQTNDRLTRGHRFMCSGPLEIATPIEYADTLEKEGFVVADFAERRNRIVRDIALAAEASGGVVYSNDDLVDEVTALTEWPVAMAGHYDESFLKLPREVVFSSMTGHQRYFPVLATSGELLPAFVFVANLQSSDAEQVKDGNERVIKPRLADAVFFWDADRKVTLSERRADLDRVVYQRGLGSMLDKSTRLEKLCEVIARAAGLAAGDAIAAASIAKCDLLTGMVGEFPELQGVMGQHYARAEGASDAISLAIGEQYRPRFAADTIADSKAGRILSLADKVDTLAGVFAIGKRPTGNKDPFGLRRAALGFVRTLIEGDINLLVSELCASAVALQPVDELDIHQTAADLERFIDDRLRSYYVERVGIAADSFEAVSSCRDRREISLADFHQRVLAVEDFRKIPDAESLAAANKRIGNMLQSIAVAANVNVDDSLLTVDAEVALFGALELALADVSPLRAQRNYAAVLARLAQLREPVDRFFDEVMVMADDPALQENRLALLARLQEPFQSVADISKLASKVSAPG